MVGLDMAGHHRTDDPTDCVTEHDRVEDRVTKNLMHRLENVSKNIMSKMTIRMILVMASSITVVGAFMVWISTGSVISHENEEHRNIITEHKMEKIQARLESDLGDVQDEVQDMSEKLDAYHNDMNKQYIQVIKEIQQISH